jgi:DNA helicase-2/ATP-dependent DNA helicase PcrA
MTAQTDLLKNLNPPQREAVTYLDGPLLILAGAGSGKTRVLTHRLAYLVGKNECSPWEILAVTFTNKAAGEMKKRVASLLGRGMEGLWVGTFHSICARMLRKEGHLLGYERDYTIYDEADKLAMIKRAMNQLAVPERKVSPKAVGHRISGAKDSLVDPGQYQASAYDPFEKEVARIYLLYQQLMLKSQAMDFDDLIFNAVRLLSENARLQEEYSRRFRHILVDEYQDTNHAQYMLVNLLARHHRRLCVVGDDDQSIYGFRGADIRNILEFESDYPEARVVRLEQNYRSTQAILECANQVVRNNRGRKGKKLWTDNPPGEMVTMWQAWDERDEAEKVCRAVKGHRARGSLRDCVVLYRTNAQSRALEDSLRRSGVPYLIVGGLKFYERKEIKDLLAYLRVLVNPADSVSLKRIVNLPARGIGETSLERAEAYASGRNITLYQALMECLRIDGLGAAVRSGMASFVKQAEELRALAGTLNAQELITRVIGATGYLDFIDGQYPDKAEADSRAENVRELASAANEFCERSEDKSLAAFLAEVSLVADIDRWNQAAEAVTLMTIHNAKGLEFPKVFITGLEEGLLPHSASFDSREDLEEERRLFYVAITRAQQELFLCHASSRRRFGGLMQSQPSRFISELPSDRLKGGASPGGETIGSLFQEDWEPPEIPARNLKGRTVRHQIWGQGRVEEVEGEGEDIKLSIVFQGGLRKKVMAGYVEFL